MGDFDGEDVGSGFERPKSLSKSQSICPTYSFDGDEDGDVVGEDVGNDVGCFDGDEDGDVVGCL